MMLSVIRPRARRRPCRALPVHGSDTIHTDRFAASALESGLEAVNREAREDEAKGALREALADWDADDVRAAGDAQGYGRRRPLQTVMLRQAQHSPDGGLARRSQ